MFYKVAYKSNNGVEYWIGKAFDRYDAIRKSKAHPTEVLKIMLLDDYLKDNTIDKNRYTDNNNKEY